MSGAPGASVKPRFSIIIPVQDEQDCIGRCLDGLAGQGFEEFREVIVVDGDPDGSTISLIQGSGATRLASAPGRARQMNAGAAVANGDILIFLHADTQLPPAALEKIDRLMATGRYAGGAFDLGIDSDRWILRYIAMRASMRSRQNRIPYGDQAIFIDRAYFVQLGGFNDMPIMEDVDLMRRIKKDRRRIHIFRDRVLTSPRRWEAEGPILTTLRNQFVVGLYYLGVSPKKLVRYYKPQSDLTRK
jgi:rSAM/selenodomain-associated transferase 2